MTQTWDLTLIAPVTGEFVGANVSAGSLTAFAHQEWDLLLLTGLSAGQLIGNTASAGVLAARGVTHQSWDLLLIDDSASFVGSTASQGVLAAVAELHVWYDVAGTVTNEAVAGELIGNTLSAGFVDGLGTRGPEFIGSTASQGGLDALTVFPLGAALLGPYWAPGEIVNAYRVSEWRGAIGARLGAGPGPVVATSVALPDSMVEFTGLANGHYIAIGAEGQRRYFFVGEP